MTFPRFYVEAKPRIVFSRSVFERTGEGWMCIYFEGVCAHPSWNDAVRCVNKYYEVDMMMAMEPLTEAIQ